MATLGLLAGKWAFGKDDAFGKRPDVPNAREIDLSQLLQQNVAGNLAALPQAQALSSAVNQGAAAQLRAVLNRGGGLDLAESTVNSQMRGELPQDVQRALQDSVAAQSLGLGLGGQGFQTGIAGLRGVLSSLQLQQQGLQNFGALSQLTTPRNMMGAESMFFTPQQRYQMQNEQNAIQYNQQWTKNQVAASPDPYAHAMTQAFVQDEQAILQMVGSVAGGAGGGM